MDVDLDQLYRPVHDGTVSVPLTLLDLLDRDPSHGCDLKRECEVYFGRKKPTLFGEVYATLARLVRDGMVTAGGIAPGAGADRKRYTINLGRNELGAWLAEPIESEPHLQTVLFAKVMLALMLGRSAETYLDSYRAAHLHRKRELAEPRSGEPIDALLADFGLFHLQADLRWIDVTEARLSSRAKAMPS